MRLEKNLDCPLRGNRRPGTGTASALEASPGNGSFVVPRLLSRRVWTRPWLRKPYEALAARLLPGADSRRDCLRDSRKQRSEMAGEYIELLSDSSSPRTIFDLHWEARLPAAR